MAVATIIFMSALIRRSFVQRSLIDMLFFFYLLLLLPIVGYIFSWLGVFDRVIDAGVWNDSSQSRFLIFEALNLLSKNELLAGINDYDIFGWLTSQVTAGEHVESVIVVIIFHAGIPTATVFLIYLLVLYGPTLRYSALFSLIFFVVLFTTLGFAVKNMIPMAVAILGYWIWRKSNNDLRNITCAATLSQPQSRVRQEVDIA